jgi:hypothetical protein
LEQVLDNERPVEFPGLIVSLTASKTLREIAFLEIFLSIQTSTKQLLLVSEEGTLVSNDEDGWIL